MNERKETEMEAREAFPETAVSKGVAVIVGLSVAAVMGAAGAFAAATLTGLNAAPAAHKSVVTSGIPGGSGWTYRATRGGAQIDEALVPTANAFQAPDAQERNQLLAAGRVARPNPHGHF
jgi:hypothetical protein